MAAQCFARESLSIKPDYGFAHMARGLALSELGQVAEAPDCFSKKLSRCNPEICRDAFAFGGIAGQDGAGGCGAGALPAGLPSWLASLWHTLAKHGSKLDWSETEEGSRSRPGSDLHGRVCTLNGITGCSDSRRRATLRTHHFRRSFEGRTSPGRHSLPR